MLGAWGKGLWKGEKEIFIKAKMNVEAQAFGHHNFAKGSVKMKLRASPKSTTVREKRMLVVLFSALLFLCNLLKARQCNYVNLSLGPGVFKSQDWYYLGSNW